MAFHPKAPIVRRAMDVKDQVEKLLWQDGGGFIYWNKIDKVGTGTNEWIIKVGEDAYKKLTSYSLPLPLVMLYVPSGASAQYGEVSIPFPIDIRGKDPSLPDWKDIGLATIDPISNATGWLLKGRVDRSFLADAKVGFILIKEEEAVNLYDWVQKVIASENEWPAQPTPFSSAMMIIPASVRDIDPPITVTLPSSEVPIQGGNFKLFCYLIKNDKHYYLSQMEHLLSDGTENSLSQESAPHSIAFTGSSYGLKVLDLKLSREKVSDQVQNVKFSDFKFEYSVNNQVEEQPADLQSSLLFVQKGTIWRTSILESLFKQSYESGNNAITTDDGTICLVRDASKLDQSSIEFFSRAADYQYFACLFSTADHKLKFYTEKEALSIEENETDQLQPQKPEAKEAQKSDELKITLDRKEANITFTQKLKGFLGKAKVTFTPPKVNLAPSGFDKDKLHPRGFVIAKAGALVSSTMAEHGLMIQKFINDNNGVSYDSDKKFVIFKEDSQDGLDTILYKAYNGEKAGHSVLVISYWAQYKDQIIWSEPVSIEIIWK